MKNSKHILKIAAILSGLVLCSACEFKEPFPEPSGDFTVYGINPVTNAYEKQTEPLNLLLGVAYDFVSEGPAEQYVFWFGTPGDSIKNSPTGRNFEDRWENHFSKGVPVNNGKARFAYAEEGTFEIVMVASSYNYSSDEYKEVLVRKNATVVLSK